MNASADAGTDAKTSGSVMPPTLWSLVSQGGAGSAEALEKLCRLYWKPIHSYLCRWGVKPTDADDVTQEFLLHLLQKDRLARPRPELGRFRSYLLKALKNFLYDKIGAEPPVTFVPMSGPDGAGEGLVELADNALPPDLEFERNGTLALIGQALEDLRSEYVARGQADRFDILAQLLPGKCPGLSQAEVAAQLGLSEGGVSKAVYDLRQKFREVFRRVVGMTVNSYDEVDHEIDQHMEVLNR